MKAIGFKNQSLLIDISLHLGSLLAILFYFRNDKLIESSFSGQFKNPYSATNHYYYNLF